MSRLSSRDRLQPSLLDRLLDEAPHEPQEPPEARALTRQQLRGAVLRDLAWLFNATQLEADPPGPAHRERSGRRVSRQDWQTLADARRSVLNFGIPALSGRSLSTRDGSGIQRAVAEAIRCFEPRIDPATLQVLVSLNAGRHHNTLQLTIRGQLWSQPVPLDLLLSADLDVETGAARVRDLRA